MSKEQGKLIMRIYDPKNLCPKCGVGKPIAKFHNNGSKKNMIIAIRAIPCSDINTTYICTDKNGDHMDLFCDNCRATWSELPIDAEKENDT